MFQSMKFRTKILLLPLGATLGFLAVLGSSTYLGAQNLAELEMIHAGYVPALELSRALETSLQSLQRAMQDAVAAEDVEALTDTRELRDGFLSQLRAGRDNPVLESAELERLEREFVDYYELALATSTRMARQETGEDVVAALKRMSLMYNGIRSRLQQHTQGSKAGVQSAFEDAQEGYELSIVVVVAITLGLLLLLLVVSVAIMRTVSGPLAQTAELAKRTALQIVTSVRQQSATISETAASVSQTSTTVDEIRQTSELALTKAQLVSETSELSATRAQEAVAATQRGVSAMRSIQEEMEGIASSIVELSVRHTQIGEIIQTVNALAEQSNLLAVNASIEAAKAGEHGRGFSVVAREVKALASQSKEAASQIRNILAEIQKSSNAAVMVTEQGTKRVEEGSTLIESLGATIVEFRQVIEDSAQAARQISLTAGQQLSGLEQITGAMKSIEGATHENAQGARELEVAAGQVESVSERIGEIVAGRSAEARA